VENDGSSCLIEAVGQMDHRMHSGEVLHHMGRPVVKGKLEAEVELLGTSGTGSGSQDRGVYQHPRKPEHWGQSGFVKPWTKVAVL
jgi:hypothetical protein